MCKIKILIKYQNQTLFQKQIVIKQNFYFVVYLFLTQALSISDQIRNS